MNTFRDLLVWQKAMVLAEEVYAATKQFPKYETYALGDQVRRAVVSVPANIAEGYGRQSTQDYIRFLLISRGSLYEVQTHCELAMRLQYLSYDIHDAIESNCQEVERMLSSLISKLRPPPK